MNIVKRCIKVLEGLLAKIFAKDFVIMIDECGRKGKDNLV